MICSTLTPNRSEKENPCYTQIILQEIRILEIRELHNGWLQCGLKKLLASKKAADLLKALKKLQRNYFPEFGNTVVDIFEERYKRNISWEVQVEAIKIIGKQHLVKALPLLEQIVKKNMEHDMVTMEAAAYFRIVRLNMRDVSPIIKSFGNIGFNFVEVQ